MTNAMTEDYGKTLVVVTMMKLKNKMWKEYADGFSITTGKKFIKVVNGKVLKLLYTWSINQHVVDLKWVIF